MIKRVSDTMFETWGKFFEGKKKNQSFYFYLTNLFHSLILLTIFELAKFESELLIFLVRFYTTKMSLLQISKWISFPSFLIGKYSINWSFYTFICNLTSSCSQKRRKKKLFKQQLFHLVKLQLLKFPQGFATAYLERRFSLFFLENGNDKKACLFPLIEILERQSQMSIFQELL